MGTIYGKKARNKGQTIFTSGPAREKKRRKRNRDANPKSGWFGGGNKKQNVAFPVGGRELARGKKLGKKLVVGTFHGRCVIPPAGVTMGTASLVFPFMAGTIIQMKWWSSSTNFMA